MNKEEMKKNLIIIIPTYNEATNIEDLIHKIYTLPFEPSVLIIDDHSPDGTAGIVEKLKPRYPKLNLINRQGKLGLASAYKEGFRYALEKGYDLIVQMDGDWSHSPDSIAEMAEWIGPYDLVVGSRYVEFGGTLSWGLGRILMSRLGNIYAKLLLWIPVNDLTSGFKMIKRNVLESLDFNWISSRGYSFQIEVTFFSFLKGFKIKECPIIFKGRRNEKSKMSSAIAFEAFFKVIGLSFYRIYWLLRAFVSKR
jgi:dolichol-phosphate mannosyltransferase